MVNAKVAWMSGGYGPSDEYHGLVLRTVDGGATWESKTTSGAGKHELPADMPYLGVTATSSDEAWVVSAHNLTRGSSVYYTEDGSETWTLQAENLVTSQNDLNDITIKDGVIWVAGDSQAAIKSVDYGNTWEKFNTTANGHCMGVAALSGMRAWLVSTGGGALPANTDFVGDIVCTLDSGKTWANQAYPARSSYQYLSDVAFEYVPRTIGIGSN